MTLQLDRRSVANLVDWQNGLVDRRIFNQQDIYEMELEQVFARAWLFSRGGRRHENGDRHCQQRSGQ